jgi:hypothetical protein
MSPNHAVRRARAMVLPCQNDVFKTMFDSISIDVRDTPVSAFEGLEEGMFEEELGDVGKATANGLDEEEVDGKEFRKAPCSNCRPLIATDLHAALVHRFRLRRVMANPDRFGLVIEEARHIRYCLLPVYQSLLKLYLSDLSIQTSDESESESESE